MPLWRVVAAVILSLGLTATANAGEKDPRVAASLRAYRAKVSPWDPTPLRAYLGGNGSRALLKMGAFKITLRKGGVPPVGKNPLIVTSVEREGSFDEVTLSPRWLRLLEREARAAGFDALFLDTIDSPRVKGVLERRMGYTRFESPRWSPSYFTLLPAEGGASEAR